MSYTLYHKNVPLLTFAIYNSEVYGSVIVMNNKEYLPLPLKWLYDNSEEFIENYVEKDSITLAVLNESGDQVVDNWFAFREIPSNRDNYTKYVKKNESPRILMMKQNACSLTDCYWVKDNTEIQNSWDDVKLYNLNKLDILKVIVSNSVRHYQNVPLTLGGQLEKFWYISRSNEDKLKLCKRTPKVFDILAIREVIATHVYESVGYNNYCKYKYVRDTSNAIVGCRCEAFTSEQVELITAYDLLEEKNITQQQDVYNNIIKCAVSHGASELEVSNYLDIQTIVDFLILNRDRHLGNIAFLRDSNTLNLLRPAPIFDSGSSKELEGALPESVEIATINGMYPTDKECLDQVKNWDVIDLDLVPDVDIIAQELDKSLYLSEDRKSKLLELYQGRLLYLKQRKLMELNRMSSF